MHEQSPSVNPSVSSSTTEEHYNIDTPSSQTNQQEVVLETRLLCRHFGSLKAVHELTFQARKGQVVGFIGPNGAGKTTTMRILATLDLPTSGDAFVCGNSVIDDPDQVRRHLGFMPDQISKYSNMDVVEYLDFFARAYGFTGAKRKDALERVLVFTELWKIADKPINTLSKGMSQRLGLGRTLIHDPQVLILDEPAAGLDPRARVELRELIYLLAQDLGKTVFISSHILTELGEICDSAVIIEAGQLLAFGDIEQLRRKGAKRQLASVMGTEGQPSSAQETEPQDRLRIALVKDHSEQQLDQLQRWLLEQPHVENVSPSLNELLFDFPSDANLRHQLLKSVIQAEFPISEFSVVSESLEDAFMNITQGLVQ